MNEKLIVLAVVAGLAAPVAAHAGVAVYGQLQVEAASVNNDGFGENNPGPSDIQAGESGLRLKDNKRGRLGVKVKEDLGAGLRAIARFEWQVDTAQAKIITDDVREGWVGLSASWGELKAGRVRTPYKYTGGVRYDPFAATYLEARQNGGMKGGEWGQNFFWDTAVSYRNRWGGFGFWIDVGLDEGNGTANDGNRGDVSAAMKYSGKDWEIFAAYNRYDANNNGTADSVAKVGGRVSFGGGSHTVSAQYELDTPEGNDNDAAILFVGYQFRMGKNILAAQYGNTAGDDNYVDAYLNGATDVTYYAIGVIHRFSKRTRVFVGYRKSEGKNPVTTGIDLSVATAGLRVDF